MVSWSPSRFTSIESGLTPAPVVGAGPVRLVEGPFAAEGDRLVLDVHLDLPGVHTRQLCLDDVLLAGVEHVDGRIHPCRGRTGRPEGALKHAVELPLQLLQWITVRDRHDTPPTWQVSPVGKLVNPSGAMPR